MLSVQKQHSYLASLGLNNTIGATYASAAYVARLTASSPAGKAAKELEGRQTAMQVFYARTLLRGHVGFAAQHMPAYTQAISTYICRLE